MSTKIYEGLKSTTADAFETQRAIQAVLEPIYYDKYERFANLVSEVSERGDCDDWNDLLEYDMVDSLNSWPWTEHLHSAHMVEYKLHEFITLLHNSDTRVTDRFNFAYTVSLLENAEGGNPLVWVRAYDNDYYKALLKSDAVSDYGYWNNSDKPKKIRQIDWDRRRDAWANAYQPGVEGLQFHSPSKTASVLETHKRWRGGQP